MSTQIRTKERVQGDPRRLGVCPGVCPGRSPWTAADAPVGLSRLKRKPSFSGHNSVRGGRADQGVAQGRALRIPQNCRR